MRCGKIISMFALSAVLLLCIQCKNDANEANTIVDKEVSVKNESSGTAVEAKIENTISGKTMYAWVDTLNVRDTPTLSGGIIFTVQPQEQLMLTGKQSEIKETIVLRGVAYSDVWLEIENIKGMKGWVFGGAIKEIDEKKGNAPVSDTHVAFENFGTFDFTTWTKEVTTTDGGGDVTFTSNIYRNPDPSLEQAIKVTHIDKGDYGYAITHTLMGMNDRLTQEHTLDVSTLEGMITETNLTHKIYPKKLAKRTQSLDVANFKNNAKVYMAQGKWTYIDLEN